MNEMTPTPPPDPYDPQSGATPPGDPQSGATPPGATQPTLAQPGGYPPYDPQPGATQPTAAQPGDHPPTGYATFGPIRRLTRSRSDRMLGGVCGGLARYWNTDPTLLRILTVVLTIFTGGALLIGYLIAWIAIPEGPMGGPDGFDQSAANPGLGYAAGGNPGYAEQYTGYEPAPRERSYLGLITLSVATLVAGVLGLIAAFRPTGVGIWGVSMGVVLAVLGLGILIGAWRGRARWLLWLAVPLAFMTVSVVAAGNWVADNPNWGRWTQSGTWGGVTVGDPTWTVTPVEAADSPLDFRVTAGDATLDLTGLTAGSDGTLEAPSTVVDITAGIGVGQLTVLLPAEATLELDATVQVGDITLLGDPTSSGSNLGVSTTLLADADTDPRYVINLDASIGAGNLEVRREAA
ncbi:MAG: PspC domain-containing protein [Candidatus Nanopelagicales bacterium]